ncbi:MAG: DUF5837 family cyanobactin class RiPP [Cyanobacteriota bacterium]|nr:DUF5837 family cyanobactin class RiPP [Cyanobacteriota bacterium]
MNKKTISPNPQQPVERKPAGQLPTALAELAEAALSDAALPADFQHQVVLGMCLCSYDGDDD